MQQSKCSQVNATKLILKTPRVALTNVLNRATVASTNVLNNSVHYIIIIVFKDGVAIRLVKILTNHWWGKSDLDAGHSALEKVPTACWLWGDDATRLGVDGCYSTGIQLCRLYNNKTCSLLHGKPNNIQNECQSQT